MMNALTLIGTCALVACSVQAQIGSDLGGCKKVWGSPLSGQLDPDGFGTFRFKSRGTTVTLDFEAGRVLKAAYQRTQFYDHDIASLLRLNNGRVEWCEWAPPGIPPEELTETTWLRSDDRAIARRGKSILRVIGSPTEPEQPESVAPKKTRVAAAAPAVASAAPVPEPKKAAPVKRKEDAVAVPDQMPAIGDSRASVIDLLGAPRGTMQTGGKEILVYGWGSVWMEGQRVIQVN